MPVDPISIGLTGFSALAGIGGGLLGKSSAAKALPAWSAIALLRCAVYTVLGARSAFGFSVAVRTTES